MRRRNYVRFSLDGDAGSPMFLDGRALGIAGT